MKVVDLHPEELIEKLFSGERERERERELSRAERERLDAHLAQCSVCRFEIGSPNRAIVPADGLESDSNSFTNVVFPARFGPNSPNTHPVGIVRLIPRTAATPFRPK